MSEVKCPKCQALQARRIKQEGFLQTAILRRLGFYPWQCRFCKAEFIQRNRGLRAPDQERGERRRSSSRNQVSANMSAD